MIKVECGKCLGKGRINAFRHVVGGTCFACNGQGFKMQKNPPRRSKQWQVGALTHEGEMIFPVFTKAARSESEAIKKARAQFARGTGYRPDTAFVRLIER
jgi:hypothetical protein